MKHEIVIFQKISHPIWFPRGTVPPLSHGTVSCLECELTAASNLDSTHYVDPYALPDPYQSVPRRWRWPYRLLSDIYDNAERPFLGITEETHQSSESNHYESEADATAMTTSDSSCFCDGAREVVEGSFRTNKTSLVTQVLLYIRYLVQGMLVASGEIVEPPGNCEHPRGTIGKAAAAPL